MSRLIISYQDIDVYERDLTLFDVGLWVNDTCINFCMKRLEEKVDTAVLLMDAAVVSFLRFQVEDEEEFDDLRTSLCIQNRSLLLVPVNDCQALGGSCSHWSMLAFNAQSGLSAHMDSSHPHNTRAARLMAQKLSQLVKRPFSDPVEVSVPQQTNGHDCGMYAILFAKAVVSFLSDQHMPAEDVVNSCTSTVDLVNRAFEQQQVVANLTPTAVTNYRQQCTQDILMLSKERDRS